MLKINLEIDKENLDPESIKKLEAASQHILSALNSTAFKDFCKEHAVYKKTATRISPWYKFWNKKYKTEETMIKQGFDYCDSTGYEVYKKLMTGKESLSSSADNEIDIYLKIDHRHRRGTIGYTYKSIKEQYIYENWFDSFDYKQLAGNLVHEWCHKMGYGHAFHSTPTRQYSVPYAVGDFVAKF